MSIGIFFLYNIPISYLSDDIKSSYIVVEDITYAVKESPVVAMDICFKIFHSLNAKYPEPCEVIWLFIQKAVYNITTKFDKNFVTVSELIAYVGA